MIPRNKAPTKQYDLFRKRTDEVGECGCFRKNLLGIGS